MNQSIKTETFLAFALGTLFLGLLSYAAMRTGPPLSPQGFFLLRAVCAVAAAGFAAVIPGFMNIEVAWLRSSVRAGGALAVFAVVYLLNPPTLASDQSSKATPAEAPPLASSSRPALPTTAATVLGDQNIVPVGNHNTVTVTH